MTTVAKAFSSSDISNGTTKPSKLDWIQTLYQLLALALDVYGKHPFTKVGPDGVAVVGFTQGRFHSLVEPLVYDAEATHTATGISARVKHFKSAKGAMKHVLDALADKLVQAGVLTSDP